MGDFIFHLPFEICHWSLRKISEVEQWQMANEKSKLENMPAFFVNRLDPIYARVERSSPGHCGQSACRREMIERRIRINSQSDLLRIE